MIVACLTSLCLFTVELSTTRKVLTEWKFFEENFCCDAEKLENGQPRLPETFTFSVFFFG